ncbi:unnamed protein product, partial [Protopolystoma xenopodis]
MGSRLFSHVRTGLIYAFLSASITTSSTPSRLGLASSPPVGWSPSPAQPSPVQASLLYGMVHAKSLIPRVICNRFGLFNFVFMPDTLPFGWQTHRIYCDSAGLVVVARHNSAFSRQILRSLVKRTGLQDGFPFCRRRRRPEPSDTASRGPTSGFERARLREHRRRPTPFSGTSL